MSRQPINRRQLVALRSGTMVIWPFSGKGQTNPKGRRELLRILGFLAGAYPFAARGQQATVGILLTGASNPDPDAFLEGFKEALREIGLIEGSNIRLEIRSAGGSATALNTLAKDLIERKVSVLVAHLTPAVQAAKQATSDIPIVMAQAGDPVGTGLVSNLSRPGGNVTGYSSAAAEVSGKTLELLHELFPSAVRVAVLANELDPFTTPYLAQLRRGAGTLGLEVQAIIAKPSVEQAPLFEAMTEKRTDALIVQGSMIRQETSELALMHRLPSFGSGRGWPMIGGLISYSASLAEGYREVASYVDKLLKGRKPADLPVSQPTKFDLVVNMRTAKALGIQLPSAFLLRADEVIE
jgi:putative ABC transport system substrate-binding protein